MQACEIRGFNTRGTSVQFPGLPSFKSWAPPFDGQTRLSYRAVGSPPASSTTSANTADSSNSAGAYAPTSTQCFGLSRENSWERPGGFNSTVPEQAFQNDISCTTYTTYKRPSCASRISEVPLASASQRNSSVLDSLPSFPSGPTATQKAPGTEITENPTPAEESGTQSLMMCWASEQGPVQVPIDIATDTKHDTARRKRMAASSYRYRQRRKDERTEFSLLKAEIDSLRREISSLQEENTRLHTQMSQWHRHRVNEPRR